MSRLSLRLPKLFCAALNVLASFVAISTAAAGGELSRTGLRIENFKSPECHGGAWSLAELSDKPLLAVVFLGVDCPLARLYAGRLTELAAEYPQLGIVGVDSNHYDSTSDIAHFAEEFGVRYPLLVDGSQRLADLFGATRQLEVFLLDRERVVRYHGRVDDQYTIAGHLPAPSRRDLAGAINELLAGGSVSVPETSFVGCVISRGPAHAARSEVTFTRDVAPIVYSHCVECHQPGQIGPFSLLSYADCSAWRDTIREVVDGGRMPPWGADPRYGHFANERRLTDAEKQTLFAWIDAGAPEGDPADLPPRPTPVPEWRIGQPDVIVQIPEPITVPAEGIIEYKFIEVDPGFKEDRWVKVSEILPTNRKVVHHATVFLAPPGEHSQPSEQGFLGSFCLTTYAPGAGTPEIVPPGMAKRIPAGWRFWFVLHYIAIGSEQTDQTRIGLVFTDPKTVSREVATKMLYDDQFTIPPGEPDHVITQAWRTETDIWLLSMFPHMHLRGRSFAYQATFPDGRSEILANIPNYDFNWQHRYILSEPKLLPQGTILSCTAHYDNSAGNPHNPDPTATVRPGLQTKDEMFNGYFDFALVYEPAPKHSMVWTMATLAMVLVAIRVWARRT